MTYISILLRYRTAEVPNELYWARVTEDAAPRKQYTSVCGSIRPLRFTAFCQTLRNAAPKLPDRLCIRTVQLGKKQTSSGPVFWRKHAAFSWVEYSDGSLTRYSNQRDVCLSFAGTRQRLKMGLLFGILIKSETIPCYYCMLKTFQTYLTGECDQKFWEYCLWRWVEKCGRTAKQPRRFAPFAPGCKRRWTATTLTSSDLAEWHSWRKRCIFSEGTRKIRRLQNVRLDSSRRKTRFV